jgi:DNA-binding SARP family transcriptional activator
VSSWGEFAWTLAPSLIIIVLFGLMLRWYLRSYARSALAQRTIEHYNQLTQHHERMEKLCERIAEALEKRGDQSPRDGSA